MRNASIAAALLSASVSAGAQDAARSTLLVGYAFDRENGAPLYTETHLQDFRGDQLVSHRTEYRTPDGALFATKSLDYSGHPFAPAFRLTDLRDGYVEGAQYISDGLRLYRSQGQQAGSEVVRAEPGLVSDSGFDQFIKARLPELVDGRRQRLRLAVAGRLTTLAFRVDTVQVHADRHEVELLAEPDSLLSFFVAPIHLTYDSNTGRLVRYAGISNIRSPSGALYDVRIEFPADGTISEPGFAASR